MKKKPVATPSIETQKEAMSIAKATQKPGQTKEQTKLIAQGIEKGIALYKKQQKERSRQADKAKKKQQREKQRQVESINQEPIKPQEPRSKAKTTLPWLLLFFSWIGFALFAITHASLN